MKSNQKSSQQRGFLRSGPLPGSSGKTSGCKIFAPLRPLLAHASAKNCYAPPQRAKATSFTCPHPKLFCWRLHNTMILQNVMIECLC
jgi:hypothetical protein